MAIFVVYFYYGNFRCGQRLIPRMCDTVVQARARNVANVTRSLTRTTAKARRYRDELRLQCDRCPTPLGYFSDARLAVSLHSVAARNAHATKYVWLSNPTAAIREKKWRVVISFRTVVPRAEESLLRWFTGNVRSAVTSEANPWKKVRTTAVTDDAKKWWSVDLQPAVTAKMFQLLVKWRRIVRIRF